MSRRSGTASKSVSLKKCRPQNTSCGTVGLVSRSSPVIRELDLVPETVDQTWRSRGSSAATEVHQPAVRFPVLLEDGDALGFGRVGGGTTGRPAGPRAVAKLGRRNFAGAAAEMTCASVPRSVRTPRSASICRRRRIAAFCSAIERSWNQIPCTWSVRARSPGAQTARGSALHAAPAHTSGARPRTRSSSSPERTRPLR